MSDVATPPAYPAYVLPSPSHTERGVRHVSYALILIMTLQLLVILVLVAAAPIISAVATINPTTPDPILIQRLAGAVIVLLAAFCALLVVAIISFVLSLLGIRSLRRGRAEFGAEHAKRVDNATVVLVIGILAPIIGGLAVPRRTPNLGVGTPLIPDFDLATVGVSVALGIVGTILIGLFLLWAVQTLSSPRERRLGFLALIVGVVGIITGSAVEVWVIVAVPLPTTPAEFSSIFLVPGIVSAAISLASLGVWFFAYRGVLDRFRRGELRAAPPPVTPMAPYPASYPPGYWPPAQPVPPPQPQMPEEPPKTPGT